MVAERGWNGTIESILLALIEILRWPRALRTPAQAERPEVQGAQASQALDGRTAWQWARIVRSLRKIRKWQRFFHLIGTHLNERTTKELRCRLKML